MQATRPNSPMAGKAPFLLLALAILVVDQWSKWGVEHYLAPFGVKALIPGCLNLIYVRNTGVAFGLFAARGSLVRTLALSALGLVALGVIALYFRRTPREQRLLLTSLGLILGGAVGNLLDRVASGAVTDFIDFYVGNWHWHTFNIADSAISIGIALMALEILLPARRPSGAQPQAPSTTGAD
jgi:signal peptidase II